jgi:LacI family transcriptional regulator
MPKTAQKPNILTVAREARVAPTTVSRVLNGGYVSAHVRARVERVIREVGYVPSTTARSLKYGRKGCIGVAVESVHGTWFMGLLVGVEEELAKKRISVMLGGLRVGGEYDSTSVLTWVTEQRVDGIIFARYTSSERPILDAARERRLPVTFICPDETLSVGLTVRCRNVDAGAAIGEHLISLGHRHIAFAGGPKASIDSRDRLRGLKEALAKAEVDLRSDDVTFGASYHPAAGERAAQEVLRRSPARRPSAVVLGNDAMALGFLREVQRAGLKAPDDVSVAGFDGVDAGAGFYPSLTSVAQPLHTLGAAATRGLLDRIERPEDDVPMTVEYPMELVVRESTGPVPSGKRAKR